VEVLRTPDGRFEDLPGYPFEPNYVTVPPGGTASPGNSPAGHPGLRVHFVDQGPADAPETVLLLHGEPSWSYLYRKMVPPLVAAGHRVVAPDLVGFGRSDKPSDRTDYTYARHVEWMRAALLDELGLDGITLVCQDWGGLIGLRLVAEHPERFRRVVAANTGLPTGDTPIGDAFLAWQRFSQTVPEMPIGGIVDMGTVTTLAPDVVAAYDAPFPDERYKEGARQFPLLVPTTPDDPAAADNRRAWDSLRNFDRPFLCAFSDGDPITAGGDRVFLESVPGAAGRPHTTIRGGGHFLQEDKGEELAAVVVAFVGAAATA
jgi:haloalkane dehalogenase